MKSLFLSLLVLIGLSGCMKEMEVVKVESQTSSDTKIVLLSTNRFDNQLRRSFLAKGFDVPAFASVNTVTNKSATQDISFNQVEARYGIRHSGELSFNNPCFSNGKSWEFKDYTLELIDFSTNKTIMFISKGGRTESCPGSLVNFIQTTDLFGDLVDELKRNIP